MSISRGRSVFLLSKMDGIVLLRVSELRSFIPDLIKDEGLKTTLRSCIVSYSFMFNNVIYCCKINIINISQDTEEDFSKFLEIMLNKDDIKTRYYFEYIYVRIKEERAYRTVNSAQLYKFM